MNIIMIPFHDYKKWINEGFRTRDAHLCEHFEKDDRVEKVLVINRPVSLAERLLKRNNWKTSGGEVVYCKDNVQISKMSSKVWCIDIFVPDFLKVAIQKKKWWFTSFNYKKVADAINNAVDILDMKDNILLLQNPMAIGAVKNVKTNKFAFDAIDNWMYHPQMKDKELIKANYQYVEDNADVIFTVSEALADSFSSHPNVKWIPNGVDKQFFSAAVKEYKKTNKITIGYVGKIQERVDFDLVEKCLVEFEDVKFLFIGPAYSQGKRISELEKKYKNIEFTGDIHYNNLPDHLKDVHIAIIPHKVDEFTNSMNPLKLYEYLAAGKPVVSTKVAGSDDISDYVFISENYDEFTAKLKEVIARLNNGELDSQKIADSIPFECTWQHRSKMVLDSLEQNV